MTEKRTPAQIKQDSHFVRAHWEEMSDSDMAAEITRRAHRKVSPTQVSKNREAMGLLRARAQNGGRTWFDSGVDRKKVARGDEAHRAALLAEARAWMADRER